MRWPRLVACLWVAVALAAVHLALVENARRATRNRPPVRPSTSGWYPMPAGFRIIQFYVSPPRITEGEHAVLCYGVQDTRAVRLEPAVERLSPSFNRCIAVAPANTTSYKLTAAAEDGREAAAQATLYVDPAPPFIFFFATSEKSIRRGEPFTFCYGVRYTSTVRLEPLGWPLPVVEKHCVKMFPGASMKYRLVASGTGQPDTAAFRVTVE